MKRFSYSIIYLIEIIGVFICITIAKPFKTSVQWPPKEPEFIDTDNDNIRGIGGKDYPIYNTIPRTSFTCNGQMPGFYADQEADCQVFHLCNNNHKVSFLCGNGTIFNQRLFTCSWWYSTSCNESHKYYSLNSELYKLREKPNEKKQILPKILHKNENKNENKNFNFDNNKKLPQKLFRLPQLPQSPKSPKLPLQQTNFNRNNQNAPFLKQTVPQTVEQHVTQRHPLDEDNEPVMRHLAIIPEKEVEDYHDQSEDYEPSHLNDENVYETIE